MRTFTRMQSGLKREIITTSDGSKSIYLPDLDENYHSIHGAVQEAKHVFIEAGLKQCNKKELTLLEVGFGTGLNAFLTALETDRKVKYVGLEAYPVGIEMALDMNYSANNQDLFETIHNTDWGVFQHISDSFQIKKLEEKLEEIEFKEQFDLVYFDAFGPRAQGEMWSMANFEKIVNAMNQGGIFVTYCAKGQVRRDLVSAGLVMERIPGPPGKREMLRGLKP